MIVGFVYGVRLTLCGPTYLTKEFPFELNPLSAHEPGVAPLVIAKTKSLFGTEAWLQAPLAI